MDHRWFRSPMELHLFRVFGLCPRSQTEPDGHVCQMFSSSSSSSSSWNPHPFFFDEHRTSKALFARRCEGERSRRAGRRFPFRRDAKLVQWLEESCGEPWLFALLTITSSLAQCASCVIIWVPTHPGGFGEWDVSSR